jgi:hypothetical protein
MTGLAQALAGAVLALAIADLLARNATSRLAFAITRGLLAGAALAVDGHWAGAGLLAFAAGLGLPWLVRHGARPAGPLADTIGDRGVSAIDARAGRPPLAALAGMVLLPLALAVGPMGVALAIVLAAVLAIIACTTAEPRPGSVRPDRTMSPPMHGSAVGQPAARAEGANLGPRGGPADAVLPLATVQIGIALAAHAGGTPDWPITLAACLPAAACLPLLTAQAHTAA